MAIFVLIGGGEIGTKETFKIDQSIVMLTNKKNPNFLFIPTASNEAEGYINVVKSIYAEILSCNFDWLSLENGMIETELKNKMGRYYICWWRKYQKNDCKMEKI